MADELRYKVPEYISIKALDEHDPEYPEIAITDKARIPVIALEYSQRDLARPKELIIDYEKGNLYIVDAEDRTILHDISKLIAENYLNNINGDNTYVNIEGLGLVNLSQILRILYQSRINLLNIMDDSVAIPTETSLDGKSIVIANNKVEVYGFHDALPLSTPRMSEDGTHIEWVGGVQEIRPGGDIENVDEPPGGFEPPMGAKQNVLYIYPNKGIIILYNKPQMFTPIKEAVVDEYEIRFPMTIMQYAKFFWRVDSETEFGMKWPGNLVWLTPKPDKADPDAVYIFECQTWDYGNTWIIKYIHYEFDHDIGQDLDQDKIYLTDEQGNILTNMNDTILYSDEDNTGMDVTEYYVEESDDDVKVIQDGE